MTQSKRRPSLMGHLQSSEPPPFWTLLHALIAVGAYIVLWIAAISVTSVISGEINQAALSVRTLTLSGLISAAVITIGVIRFSRARHPQGWMEALRLDQPAGRNTLLGIVLFSLGFAWSIDLLGAVLRLKGGQIVPPALEGLREGTVLAWLLAAVYGVILLPLAEGLVFGGLLYPALSHRLKDNRAAILVGAIIYMVVNLLLAPTQGQWYAVIQPLLMGVVMLSFRAYYQSARAAILTRAAFGVFFVLAAAFSYGFGAG
ncbi:MAG: hypothetical protein IT322_07005 [Anaerolineae bacterium]|nr:hypothetical protein [Anaerolineae bacterium]